MLSRSRIITMPLIIMAVLLAGCSSEYGSRAKARMEMAAPPVGASKPEYVDAPKDNTAEPMPRKIIYTATLEMNTTKFKDSVDQLAQCVKTNGGYIAETNITGTGEEPKNGTWKVRIPVAKYEAFLTAVGGIGEVTNSSSTSEDVSEEFYDIQARLANKRVEEARLIQHLKASTGKLSEILQVEKEISRVREEIERMEGRMRFLSHQTDFTTVTINMHELQSLRLHENSPSFGTQIGRAFTSSLSGIGTFTKNLVLVVAYLLPWLAILAGIGIPTSIVLQKRRAKQPLGREYTPESEKR